MDRFSPDDGPRLAWTEDRRKRVFEGRIFSIHSSRQHSPDGREGDFTLLECPDWVNVAALSGKGKETRVLMVRQYRFGGRMVTTEFPGGVVDPGEDPLEAAQRELREEWGCAGGTWEFLGSMNPNPAFMTNRVHSFLVRDPLPDHRGQDLDALELLEKAEVSLGDLAEGRVGDFATNGVMMCTWYWLSRWLLEHPEYGRA